MKLKNLLILLKEWDPNTCIDLCDITDRSFLRDININDIKLLPFIDKKVINWLSYDDAKAGILRCTCSIDHEYKLADNGKSRC